MTSAICFKNVFQSYLFKYYYWHIINSNKQQWEFKERELKHDKTKSQRTFQKARRQSFILNFRQKKAKSTDKTPTYRVSAGYEEQTLASTSEGALGEWRRKVMRWRLVKLRKNQRGIDHKLHCLICVKVLVRLQCVNKKVVGSMPGMRGVCNYSLCLCCSSPGN